MKHTDRQTQTVKHNDTQRQTQTDKHTDTQRQTADEELRHSLTQEAPEQLHVSRCSVLDQHTAAAVPGDTAGQQLVVEQLDDDEARDDRQDVGPFVVVP